MKQITNFVIYVNNVREDSIVITFQSTNTNNKIKIKLFLTKRKAHTLFYYQQNMNFSLSKIFLLI